MLRSFMKGLCFIILYFSHVCVLAKIPKSNANTNLVASPNKFKVAKNAFFKTIADSRKHLASAAIARSISIFAMYPIDTIKTRIQMGKPLTTSGLYKGVTGSLFGQIPYGALTFGSYETYKRILSDKFKSTQPIFLYAISAVLGDVTGSFWLCPSEVVKQQLQAGMHSNTQNAIKGIWKNQGPRGFYQGYIGGLLRDVPFRVSQLTSYEITKKIYLKRKRLTVLQGDTNKAELNPIDSAICGAISGSFSAAITCPLDRIKTLLMTDGTAYGGSIQGCIAKIWKEEGFRGFTTGMVPRVSYIAPSVAIFFIAYEQAQQKLSKI